ncbi:MAG: hypothetical protein JXJ20_01335 [Anaerolineae bacterium]|nr:hypothetical protein [Anaerolineae bacterium]
MDTSSDVVNAPKEFLRFFKAGKEAAKRGDNAQAHELFRKAVEVDPYHEPVWLWLAQVVETDEDRRVCFENVLELNPDNPTARHQLQMLEKKVLAEALDVVAVRARRPAWQRWLLRLLLVVFLSAVGVAAGVALGLV